MWSDRRLLELFEIEHPIVLAAMAGFGTVELAAASQLLSDCPTFAGDDEHKNIFTKS